ncbi:alpha/beta fold hydrolase [Zymomonas mobilis]|uniref:Uncharacterized protein n=1 Tax=Zymomonas mobilis subsp. pomaceae (strain ATCC 29192 / DSM 22645 / JCM 10191 / CCUG 17912 / NBRC 13757 / NCIMB 11200 / NRRL B-4491 / Barker I) TaxID=579138 RepID=F8EU02_ZYMMT|nr:alpha/beta hydrolase family protein [Zymomonas mobilis]AEI38099.1 conserved hypothetical protein [Zymomonas mobilis subsp. pomaceae ATCC 29192]MDX5949465.1 alpha/beta hydrolase family protein [Zymomonas mobilis subsp. pomaceae]GEB89208.1 alpha/beta hydrolase [Zymomonas mobilis subsp. pomaceae]
MQPPRFLFVHGWGFDKNFWNAVRQNLGEHLGSSLDFGYFDKANLDYDWSQPFIAIGHSLGFLWLLQQPLFACSGLISINGFTRFSASDDWPLGIPKRITERMLIGISRNPAIVIQQFRHRLNYEASLPDAFNLSALEGGLRLLLEQNNHRVCQTWSEKIAALSGDADPILPAALTKACFAKPIALQWQKDGGHLLPLTNPKICANFIQQQTQRFLS